MYLDLAPLSQILAPIGMVVALMYIMRSVIPTHRPSMRFAVFVFVMAFVLRYLDWRLRDTVLAAEGTAFEVFWVWLCFLVETMALIDAGFLYIAFLRHSDRRAEADRHEARLRATPPALLPSVDVLIPSYNEPLDVLEKTIVGALSLDYPNFKVWVLDDGRRSWLRDFCLDKNVGYITRPDNSHAKAGNINHALQLTDGAFIAIFDADFIPQRNFLLRTLGFFEDPHVGIVQAPHAFYNHDPMQANLALRRVLPDDQRFFFDSIMPSRDGWNAAFCCGSNSVTRRSAIDTIGTALPTGSITEDMLLTLTLLRQGFVTRYLNERLAVGLAPESLKAFFVQRQRWARGAMQILYLKDGPLGPGLSFMHRILFMPTHWLSQGLTQAFTLCVPVIFLWTGLIPIANVTTDAILFYQIPTFLAVIGGIRFYASQNYFPLAATVLATFQSFKLLPTVLTTLIRPHGHVFKVTPKGSDAHTAGYERGVFWTAACLIGATVGGLLINASPAHRVVEQSALIPLVAFWSMVNVVVLLLVGGMCLQNRVRRTEERFALSDPIWVRTATGDTAIGRLRDLSLSGGGVCIDAMPAGAAAFRPGDEVSIFIPDVGVLAAKVARITPQIVGLHFNLPNSVERDLLIRKLFTSGFDNSTVAPSAWAVTYGLLRRIVVPDAAPAKGRGQDAAEEAPSPPQEKLPARTLVVPPGPPPPLADLAEGRRRLAG